MSRQDLHRYRHVTIQGMTLFDAYAIGTNIDRSYTNHRIFGFYYDQLYVSALREIKKIFRWTTKNLPDLTVLHPVLLISRKKLE